MNQDGTLARLLCGKRFILEKTLREIGSELGEPSTLVSQLETGRYIPGDSKLLGISKVYGIDFEEVVKATEFSRMNLEAERILRKTPKQAKKQGLGQEELFHASVGRRATRMAFHHSRRGR